MPAAGQAYLTAVIAAGIGVVVSSLLDLREHPLGYQWYMLAALTLISGSATVTLPTIPASISVSETFVFASVLLFGRAAGTVMVALDGLVISFWMARRRPEWYRALFNMSAPAASIWLASFVLFDIGGIHPLLNNQTPVNKLLIPLALFAVAYFSLNSWLIAFMIAFERRISPYHIWRESFLLASLNYLFGASVALLLVVYTRDVDLTFIGVILPLLLVSYLTYKTTLGRVDDANRHLEQLNRLYLSTIETLAMAIDAKDQVTHGHIRRVQAYATRLAQEVGVKDSTLIKAIEAAALLHDMGKLAVPEYILNKPGPLTPAEFEKMKAHANVGADILSAIDFPYPVVPIVRYHHENWDGSGYPAGLRGTDIPIGARILSVVDCFDALTSDRPYRPKLSDQEALAILNDRRGNMYDPLVVDTFIRVHPDIVLASVAPDPDQHAFGQLATSSRLTEVMESRRLDEITASADEMLTLYDLARSLSGRIGISDSGDVIAKHLRRLVPYSLCVFYVYSADTDDLEAKYAVGHTATSILGTRIAIGQRLTGWVAANKQTIANSDPVLDLGDLARTSSPRLRSCLSTPLMSGDSLVGVVTLYSNDVAAFNDDHRRIIEVISKQIAYSVKHSPDTQVSRSRDPLTNLPRLGQLEALVQTATDHADSAHFALIFIDVIGLKRINTEYGRAAGDHVLRHVSTQAGGALRVADILFRVGSDEFIAFLSAADAGTAQTVAARICKAVISSPVSIGSGAEVVVSVSATPICRQSDSESLTDLIAAAKTALADDAVKANSTSVH